MTSLFQRRVLVAILCAPTYGALCTTLYGGISGAFMMVSPERLQAQTDQLSHSTSMASLPPTSVDTLLPDTMMLPGRQSFATYARPGLCLAAARGVQRVLTRADYDTLLYNPERDTVTSAAAATARRCGARFAVSTVPVSELLDLMHVALLAGDDAQAQAAAERYVASVSDAVQHRRALYAVDTTYLKAKPMRRAAAEAITARLDSLGPVAALQRFRAHFKLGEDADQRYTDIPRLQREALATLNAYTQISRVDRNDMDAGGPMNAMGWLFEVELYRSPKDAIARTEALAQSAGFTETAAFGAVLHGLRLDWAVQQIGTTIPPLVAQHWNPDSSEHRWPVPGKVSIYLPGNRKQGPELYALWKHIGRRYGDKLNITIMEATRGYFREGDGGRPLTPAQEAVRLGTFYRDELGVPATLAVEESPVRVLPDGRRLTGAASFESNAYYRMAFILTDQTGKILLLSPGGLSNEAQIDAWISRALGHR